MVIHGYFFFFDKGNCFSFNTGFDSLGQKIPLKSSIRAGSQYGLKLTLYVNYYELIASKYSTYMGAIIKIGNSSYEDTSFGIETQPGLKTNIQIDRVIQKTLPKPFSNCDIDNENERYESTSDLYNLIKNSNYQYSQQLCFEVCSFREVIKQCNCTVSNKFVIFD